MEKRARLAEGRTSKAVAAGVLRAWLPGLSLVVAFSLLLIATVPMSVAAPATGALVVAVELDATSFFTPRMGGTPTLRVAEQMYENLVTTNVDGTHNPVLATQWTVSPDMKTWTFTLRRGVRFHDGTPFNAAAVVRNYELIMGPDSLVGSAFSDVIARVEAVDDSTVRFTLKGPRVSFIEEFVGERRAYMMSPTAVERSGRDYGRRPVGTGPFKFVEWRPDDRIVVERNDQYWGGAPKLERIIFRPIPDPQTVLIEIETGNIHVANKISPDHLPKLRSNSNVTLLSDPTLTYRALHFNVNRAPFNELAVRKAIVHAVDMDKIVTSLGRGLAVRSRGPVYPQSWSWDPAIREHEYNPQLSEKTLTEAGWSKVGGAWQKDGKRLDVAILTSVGRWVKDREMIDATAGYLRQFGIDARGRPMEWAAFLDAVMKARDHDMTIWGAGPAQPEPALTALEENFSSTGKWNPSAFKDPAFDALLQQAASTRNREERKRHYVAAQRIVMDRYWSLGMFNDVDVVAVRNEIQGYKFTIPLTRANYTQVTVRGR